MTSLSDRAKSLLWLFIATGLLVLSIVAWPEAGWLKNDFQALLPAGSNDHWVAEANTLAASAYEGQLLILVEGEDAGTASQFLSSVGEQLASQGLVAADVKESETENWRKLGSALYPFRWNLLTALDQQGLERDPRAHLEEFRRQLYSPLGGAFADKLLSDPMGFYRNYLMSAIPMNASMGASEAVQFAVFNIAPGQRGLGTAGNLYDTYSRLKTAAEQQGMELYATGAPLYASYGAHSAGLEISTIGMASVVLLVVLQLALLRSFTAIALTALSVLTGVAGGIIVTVLISRQLHILTLIFGTTIIGIAVDYSFHYLSPSLLPDWRRDTALSRVFTGLVLGMVSSVVAFLALTYMPFPAIRQIGMFMAAGLFCSFLTVCLLFPLLYRGPPAGSKLPAFISRSEIPLRSVKMPLLILLLAIPGWTQLVPRDEVREFYGQPVELRGDQEAITSRLAATPDSRYLLVRGVTPEAVLTAEEHLRRSAELIRSEAAAPELRGISNVIPSVEAQQRNFVLIRQLLESGALSEHLDALGFAPKSRDEVLNSIPSVFNPIQLAAIEQYPLPLGLGGFIGCRDGECASWLRIAEPGAADMLSRVLHENPAATLVDPIGDINALLADYRQAVIKVMLAGTLSILILMCLLYGWRRAVQVVALPVTTCLLTISAIGYLHGSYTIINLLGLMLLIGVSMDYAVFRIFHSPTEQPAVTLAITLSALTSFAAFGMLAFSRTPLISSFGETIAIGFSIAYALSWLKIEWRV